MSIENKKIFIDLFNKREIKTIGEFKDERDKWFVIYQKPGNLFYFITGDDFYWEVDWRISEKGLAFKSIYLAGEQKERAINILTKK